MGFTKMIGLWDCLVCESSWGAGRRGWSAEWLERGGERFKWGRKDWVTLSNLYKGGSFKDSDETGVSTW
jgi:hypothetical protein